MNGFAELFGQYDVLGAFAMTIALAACSAVGALVIGTIVAIMRVSPIGILQTAGAIYVNAVRNTPLTLIVFFFCFAVSQLMGFNPIKSDTVWMPMFYWGVVALSIYTGAFVAEALRSGVNTVPVGQAEAARAVGLDFGQSLREVILPQAFRGAIAPLGNALVALTKNTTVLSTVGLMEASYLMKNMIEFSPQFLLLIFAVIAFGFVVLTLPVGMFFTWWSKKLAVAR